MKIKTILARNTANILLHNCLSSLKTFYLRWKDGIFKQICDWKVFSMGTYSTWT